MRDLELNKIAEKENADLSIEENQISGELGVNLIERKYLFTSHYKQKAINILMESGLSAVGRAKCNICNPNEYLEFKMTTRSHFENLFFRKDRFKLISRNPNVELFFSQSSGLVKLKEISKNTAFEPTILGLNTDSSYQLIIEFSLIFSDWHQVIKPIIEFYKEFIDRFGDASMCDSKL